MNSRDFLQMLQQSELLPAAALQRLEQQWSSRETLDLSETLAGLVSNRLISPWQSELLTAGQTDVFRVGNYLLQDRVATGPLSGCFIARHVATRHPVLLQFVPGVSEADEAVWEAVSALADQASQIRHPSIARYHQTVSMPNYRFVVEEVPTGKTFTSIVGAEMTSGKRIAWKTACELIRQAASGVDELHQAGIIHNAISPHSLWIDKTKSVTVRLQFLPNMEFEPIDRNDPRTALCKFDFMPPESELGASRIDERSDLYSLGCVLYWLLTGEALFTGDSPAARIRRHKQELPSLSRLGKDIPDQVSVLLKRLLAKQPDQRFSSAAELASQLTTLPGAKPVSPVARPAAGTLGEYEAWLDQWTLPVEPNNSPEAANDDDEAAIDWSPNPNAASEVITAQSLDIPAQPRRRSRRRKRVSWPVQIAIMLLTVGSAAASAWVVVKFGVGDPGSNAVQNAAGSAGGTAPSKEMVAPHDNDSETSDWVNGQRLIDDDQQTLWEHPTNGAPIDFSWIPSSPALIATARVQELLSDDEGLRMKKALGQLANENIDAWMQALSLDANSIERLQVSLHLNESFRYDAICIVDLSPPQPIERLITDSPMQDLVEAGNRYPARIPGKTILVTRLGDSNAVGSSNAPVSQFAIGPPSLVEQAAETRGAQLLSGPLLTLASTSDSQQHVSVLTTRQAWFNDAGQALMGQHLRSLNRQLDVAVDEMVTAMQLGLHVDDATFLQLDLAHRPDIKSPAMKAIAREVVSQQLTRLAEYSQAYPSNYWLAVQQNIPGMVEEIVKRLRWKANRKTVVANVWLPKQAAHNLLAIAELASWQMAWPASNSSTTSAVASTSPQTLEELLRVKRSLVINNPPDLGVLLEEFQNEILSDYSNLPFEFKIRLSGNDLRQEGITQNQRPGSLSIENQTIADVLTSIVVSANPDKTISGPGDVNCKLVWTIAKVNNNNPGKILITTRVAAVRDGTLPAAFASDQSQDK